MINIRNLIKKFQLLDVWYGRRSKVHHGLSDSGNAANAIGDITKAKFYKNKSVYNINDLDNEPNGGHYHDTAILFPTGYQREVTVGNSECDFTTVLEGFNYCNTYATSSEPLVLKVITGNHDVTDTLVHTNFYFIGLRGEHNTNLEAATGLTNKPMMTSSTDFYVKEINLDGSTLANYGDLSTEILISLTRSTYTEFINMFLYGGYHGMKIDGQIEFVGDFISIFNAEQENLVLDNGTISYFTTSQMSNSTESQIILYNTVGASPSTKLTLVDTQVVQTLGGGLAGTGTGITTEDNSRLLSLSGTQIFRFDKGIIAKSTSSLDIENTSITEITTYSIQQLGPNTINIIGGSVEDGEKLNISNPSTNYINSFDPNKQTTLIGNHSQTTSKLLEVDRDLGANNPHLDSEPDFFEIDTLLYHIPKAKPFSEASGFGVYQTDTTTNGKCVLLSLQYSDSTTDFNDIESQWNLWLANSDFDPSSPVLTKLRGWKGIIQSDNASNPLAFVLKHFNGISDVEKLSLSTDSVLKINNTQENLRSDNADITALVSDRNLLVDSIAMTRTVTLYDANGNSGKRITIVKTKAQNTVIIDGNGSDTINGNLTYTLTAQYEAVTLLCDGSDWYIV